MFNLFKKRVTAKESGHQTWLYCINLAEQFCLRFRPELQAAGYVKNPDEDRRFMDEAMNLHIWIIFCTFGHDNSHDTILEEFNNCAMTFVLGQQGRGVSMDDRFKSYYQAYSKDIETIKKRGIYTDLAKTALQCLVVNYKGCEPIIEMTVQMDIMSSITATHKLQNEIRNDFKIK